MKLIELTQGYFTKVDDHLFDLLNRWSWYAHVNKRTGKVYAARTINKPDRSTSTVFMHRQLTGFPDIFVDHKDGDSLNNRVDNLRRATNSQNQANSKLRTGGTSRYKGVYQDKGRAKWRAAIKYNGSKINLGSYDTEDEAAEAYNKKAIELFGEYAKVNELCI